MRPIRRTSFAQGDKHDDFIDVFVNYAFLIKHFPQRLAPTVILSEVEESQDKGIACTELNRMKNEIITHSEFLI